MMSFYLKKFVQTCLEVLIGPFPLLVGIVKHYHNILQRNHCWNVCKEPFTCGFVSNEPNFLYSGTNRAIFSPVQGVREADDLIQPC